MASIIGCPFCYFPITFPASRVADKGELVKDQVVQCQNCKAQLELSLRVKVRPKTMPEILNTPSK